MAGTGSRSQLESASEMDGEVCLINSPGKTANSLDGLRNT